MALKEQEVCAQSIRMRERSNSVEIAKQISILNICE